MYGYDSYGRLSSMSNQTSGGAVIAAFTYEMDNNGNHTAETENIPNGLTAPTPTNASIPYTHDDANRMLTRNNTIFNYDNNGNNTKATGEWNSNYTYDIRDNLLTSTTPALTCEYDALENRRMKNQTRYVLDILGGNNVLMETDLSGNPTAYYIHGLGMICRLDAAQANPAYFHYDYRGSTIAISNAGQTVTHRYAYGTFGEMAAVTENGFPNSFRYVGKYGVQYEENSLYFMRARYYNPQKGRFLGEDPIWNTNLYGYTDNNPINRVDFSGENWITDGMLKQVENWSVQQCFQSQQWWEQKLFEATKNNNKYLIWYYSIGWSFLDLWINDFTREIIKAFAPGVKLERAKWVTQIFGKTGYLKWVDMRTTEGRLLSGSLNAIYNIMKENGKDNGKQKVHDYIDNNQNIPSQYKSTMKDVVDKIIDNVL